MEREILFRGKTDSGNWVYGDLVKNGKGFVIIQQVESGSIRKEHNKYWSIDAPAFEVIPETVGQFTGLTDKHSTKIFEGDIIASSNGNNYEVYWHPESGSFRFKGLKWDNGSNWPNIKDSIVIGNIHDA